MSMMDTSTKFENRQTKKKLIIYNCRQCPKSVFYRFFGLYCEGINLPNKKDREIENIDKIPDWCPLDDEI